ncbi:hypothetical protein NUACC21_27670 [Scytonema sp. NUACC21]
MTASLWEQFCSDYNIIETSVPLFETQGNVVLTTPYGNDRRLLLQRSMVMEDRVIREVNKVLADFHQGTNEFEGLI